MSIINRVKQHISDNRGKYGAAAGAGAMYGASKIDSPLINQAGFNVLAKGQNLALDVADKIDPRATVALNDLGMHKIRQEDIDASNALYNSGVAKYINPNPIDMVNANEHSTEAYNKAMAAKASAQDALVNAKNQGQNYIDQGVNYIKGLNPFTENTIPGKTMKIEIKQALLEGHTPEVIVEAVHANHPELSKSKSGVSLGYTRKEIQGNRDNLAKEIKDLRSSRDHNRELQGRDPSKPSFTDQYGNPLERRWANEYDNRARQLSQTGSLNKEPREVPPSLMGRLFGKKLNNLLNLTDSTKLYQSKPRVISSAKQ